MDPEEQLDKDQTDVGEGVEVQPEVKITVTPVTENVLPLGDPGTEDVHPTSDQVSEDVLLTGDASPVDVLHLGDLSTEDVHPTGDPVPEDVLPMGDPIPEDVHPTSDPVPEDVHPTSDPVPEDLYPTGDPVPEDVHPTGDQVPKDVHPTGDPVPEDAHPTGDPVPEDKLPMGDPVPEVEVPDTSTQEVPDTSAQEVPDTSAQEVPDTSAQEVPDTSAQEVPDASTQEVPDTSAQEVPDTSAQEVPDTSAQEVPDTSAQEVPDTSAQEVPDTSAQEVPDTSAQEVPDTSAQEVPDTSAQEVPDTSAQEVPDTSAQEVPDTSAQEVPDTSAQEVPDTSAQEVPDTSAQEVPDTSAQEVPDTSAQEVPDTSAQEVPDTSAQEVPDTSAQEVPDTSAQEVPDTSAQEVPDTSAQEVPDTSAQEVPDTSAQEVPDTSVQEVPDTSAQEVPDTSAQEVPDTSAQEVPDTSAQEVPDTSAQEVPDTSAQEVPDTSVQEVPDTSAQEVPDTSAQEVPDTSAQEVPDTSAQEVPDTSAQEVPDTSAQEVPDTSAQEVPDTSAQEVPDTSAQEVPDTSAQEVPDTSAQEVPDTSAQEVPDTSAQEVPDTSAQEVPDTSAQEVPDTSAQEVPDTSVQEVPDTSAQEVPDTSAQEVPDTSAQEVPDTSAQEVPDTSAQEVPDTSAQEVPDTSAQEVPDTSAQEVPDTSAQEVPDTSAQEVPDTSAQEVPDTSAQEVPDTSAQEVPDTSVQEVPDTSAQEVPDTSAQEVPDTSAQEVPDTSTQKGETLPETQPVAEEEITQENEEALMDAALMDPGTRKQTTEDMGDAAVEPLSELKSLGRNDSPDPNAFITVKVKLMPTSQVITATSRLGQTVGKLKEYYASELKMQQSQLRLMYQRVRLNDSVTLGHLGVEANETIQLEMTSTDPANLPLKPFKHLTGLENIPDIISVNVPEENGETRTLTVEIEKQRQRKPYLGGFRHKFDGTEFHNASAQTLPKPRAWPVTVRYTRSTQTAQVGNKVMQTTQDSSTQMTKIGCFVSLITDKLKAPGVYFTAQEKEDLILKKVIILQTYLRQYLAKKQVKDLKMKRDRRREFERVQCQQRKAEKEKRIKSEFERRMHPRAKEDFDTLYDALEKWRLEEIARINSTLTGAERKAALYMLLNQETEHLAAIGRHKLEADTENRENNIQNFLYKTAAPKMVKSTYDNKPTYIDSPYTVRAKELRDIYNSLIMKHLTQDERLDILLTLKHTVNEHDCKLTHEILQLVDREADLLVRGVSNENLEGLRKRIATLYLQYLKTPKFNPEATKFIRVPPDPAQISGKIYFCTSCSSYLQATEFPLNVNARNPGSCQRCQKKDNQARYRTDYSSYRHMLKVLRLSEEQRSDGSTVAFILQEADIRYLVEKIWGSESIISNSNDLYDLVLIRWDPYVPWSPWNCLLVTIEEAEKHGKLESIYKDYGQVFINKVQLKHQQARNYFSRLPGTAELLYKQQTNLVIDCTDSSKKASKQNASTIQENGEKI